jgi:hypothetical protein
MKRAPNQTIGSDALHIEAIGENKIIICLSSGDMEDLDITYEDMDYSNIETRRVIWTILAQARQTLGRDIDPSGKMLIEAIPRESGGCEIHFTVAFADTENGSPISKEAPQPLVCEFENASDLIDAARFLSADTRGVTHSELYAAFETGAYRMILTPGSPRLQAALREFGRVLPSPALAAAITRERFEPLCTKECLQKLAEG